MNEWMVMYIVRHSGALGRLKAHANTLLALQALLELKGIMCDDVLVVERVPEDHGHIARR